jgi:hypothetical protein
LDEKIIEKWIQQLSKEENLLKKSLKAVAILTELLKERGIKPILVGGRALEFYTLGGYATKDIDLVINGREYAKEAFIKRSAKMSKAEIILKENRKNLWQCFCHYTIIHLNRDVLFSKFLCPL